jgi:hypothetical protein
MIEATTITSGDLIATVGRDGAKVTQYSSIYTGKLYQATPRKRDGVLVWRLVKTFGGTRTAKVKPSRKFAQELRKIAADRGWAWLESCKQHKVCCE